MDSLLTPLSKVVHLTALQESALQEEGIYTLFDLLKIFPSGHEDRRFFTPFSAVRPYTPCQCIGEVVSSHYQNKKRQLSLLLKDESGTLRLTLFHCYYTFSQKFTRGVRLLIYGTPKKSADGSPIFLHPRYRFLKGFENEHNLPRGVQRVYPKIPLSAAKHQSVLQAIWAYLEKNLPPPSFLDETISLFSALQSLHLSALGEESLLLARERLALEELLASQLALHDFYQKSRQGYVAPKLSLSAGETALSTLLESLPFSLTKGQERIFANILQDLKQSTPGTRLVQGEVGSGKTLLAIMASVLVVLGGGQVAILVPTGILAHQHHQHFQRWLAPLGIEVCLLLSKTPAKQKRAILKKMADGVPLVVIGTQTLCQEGVHFRALSLVCFDEQQRFGVRQRLRLLESRVGATEDETAEGDATGNNATGNNATGNNATIRPHQLMLTATPIPRTLALCLVSESAHDLLRERPQESGKVDTRLFSNEKREALLLASERFLKGGGQVYWVCPRVEKDEESETPLMDIHSCYEWIESRLPHRRLAKLHGKMTESEKCAVMADFSAGEVDILITTTVVEVGIDVHNANLMVIENAERFGLSQLHQLRGRVGRGKEAGYCFLMTSGALARLRRFCAAKDGFEVASLDLSLRGSGEFFGVRQSGEEGYQFFDEENSAHLYAKAADFLPRCLSDAPLKTLLIQRWHGGSADYLRA